MLALALGIGAATTIFSVIYNVLLDPFPYADPRRVVSIQIHDVNYSGPQGRMMFMVPEFLEYQEQSHVFDRVMGGGWEDVLYTTGEGTERFNGGCVTPNTFRFLGVPALLGRGLTLEDGEADAQPVFVMSYKTWRDRFNGDSAVLGRTFILNGTPRTLVGVMPPRFQKLGADVWRPVSLDRSDPEGRHRYFMFQGHLKPGITLREVEADITVIARRLALVYPKEYPKKFTVHAESWVDSLVGRFKKVLYTLLAAVGLLLLIACSNVANMLLAQASAREKEMAIRASLGASRWRLIRQLLVESLLLALGGAAGGCLLSYGGIKALVTMIPEGTIPSEAVISLNVPVLLASLAAAALTALLFGLAPALHMVKPDIVEPLKDSGKGVSGGFRHGKLRNALVVVEVGLSLVLMVGAGLLMRSFVRLQQVDLGFNPDNILVARLPLPKEQYKTAAAKQHFFRQLLPRLYALPGVVAATVRREIWAVDRSVAVTLTGSLQDYLKLWSYSEPRFSLILLSVFAGVGLALVAIGIYSLIAYTVSRQTHEIGIRMVLGAGRADVLRMVLSMGARLIGLGVIAGLVASFGVARLIASQLWSVSPYDPITLCGVVAMVAMVGLAACYFPARRATHVDPMVALRYE
jgi:putative ABC transport system permease protein